MCNNKVSYYIPRGYDYREFFVKCGNTDPHGGRAVCDTARPNTVTRSAPKRKPSPQTTGHPDPPDGETGDYYHTAGASVPADPLARARVSESLKGARFARIVLRCLGPRSFGSRSTAGE
jgi:hypothetical protein